MGLESLGKHNNQLMSMDIGESQHITDEGIIGFSDGCQNITDMNLTDGLYSTEMEQKCRRGYFNISKSGASAPAHNCPILRTINLSSCKRIVDIGISALIYVCPLLSDINLAYCRRLIDMGISALASSCPHLSNINLSYRKHITDIGISALACCCIN